MHKPEPNPEEFFDFSVDDQVPIVPKRREKSLHLSQPDTFFNAQPITAQQKQIQEDNELDLLFPVSDIQENSKPEVHSSARARNTQEPASQSLAESVDEFFDAPINSPAQMSSKRRKKHAVSQEEEFFDNYGQQSGGNAEKDHGPPRQLFQQPATRESSKSQSRALSQADNFFDASLVQSEPLNDPAENLQQPNKELAGMEELQFPLQDVSEYPCVVNYLLTQLQSSNISISYLAAAVLCRFQKAEYLQELLKSSRECSPEQLLEQNDYRQAMEAYLKQNRRDKALAVAVKHGLDEAGTMAERILADEDIIVSDWKEGFSRALERPEAFLPEYKQYIQSNQPFQASLLQIACNYTLEPCALYCENAELSMYPYIGDKLLRRRYAEIIEFSQLYCINERIPVHSLNRYNLNCLPFYPFLLEAKTEEAYVNVAIRHFKTMLLALSKKEIDPAGLKNTKYAKFVAFSMLSTQNYCREEGERLFAKTKSIEPIDEQIYELGTYLECDVEASLGKKIGEKLTVGLGKLLGTI